jgi:hypothetical protein
MEGVWYRCNGQLQERGILEGKCPGKSIKGPNLEKVAWNDIERFLRRPGGILDELTKERETNPQAERDENDRETLRGAMKQIAGERQNAIRLGTKGTITDNARREAAISEPLDALLDFVEAEPEPVNEDMLVLIRRRLGQGLSDEERQEIVQLLVKRITFHTEGTEPGKKTAKAVVEYRFSKTVVSDCTGRGSSLPLEPANSASHHKISWPGSHQTKRVHTTFTELRTRRRECVLGEKLVCCSSTTRSHLAAWNN